MITKLTDYQLKTISGGTIFRVNNLRVHLPNPKFKYKVFFNAGPRYIVTPDRATLLIESNEENLFSSLEDAVFYAKRKDYSTYIAYLEDCIVETE